MQRFGESAVIETGEMRHRVGAFVAGRPMRPMALVQKEILARQSGYASVFEDALGEVFVARQGGGGGIVLREGGTAAAAEAMAGCCRSDLEQQSGITVQGSKAQVEMGAGEGGMNGLVGIKDRLRSPKILKGSHETAAVRG